MYPPTEAVRRTVPFTTSTEPLQRARVNETYAREPQTEEGERQEQLHGDGYS